MSVSIVLSMRGNMYASLIVLLLSFLKSIQKRKLPSFFLTRTTFEENGLFDGRIAPASNISFKCCLKSSYIVGGIRLYGSLNGVSSMSFISWSTKSVLPKSVGPVENICDQLLSTSFAWLNWSGVRFSESILIPNSSKLVVVDFCCFFTEESGVHESTTLTLLKEHNRDLGGISVTRADKLQTLTRTLTVDRSKAVVPMFFLVCVAL